MLLELRGSGRDCALRAEVDGEATSGADVENADSRRRRKGNRNCQGCKGGRGPSPVLRRTMVVPQQAPETLATLNLAIGLTNELTWT